MASKLPKTSSPTSAKPWQDYELWPVPPKAPDERTRAEVVDLKAKWDELDVKDRRPVVQALAERIEVGRRSNAGTSAPDRVKVTCRQEDALGS